jgi:hypothetical protein
MKVTQEFIREDPVLVTFSLPGTYKKRMAIMALTSEVIHFRSPTLFPGDANRMKQRFRLRRFLWTTFLDVFGKRRHMLAPMLEEPMSIELSEIKDFQTWTPFLSGPPAMLLSDSPFGNSVSFELLRSTSPIDQESHRDGFRAKPDEAVAAHFRAVERAWQTARQRENLSTL